MDIEQLREDEASFRKGEVSLKTYKLAQETVKVMQEVCTPEQNILTKEALREEHVLRLEAKVAQLKERNKELFLIARENENALRQAVAEFQRQINLHGIFSVVFALVCGIIGYGLARF